MSYRKDAETRDRILQILCDAERKKPDPGTNVTRDKMLEILDIDEKLMDFNIHYLQGKHFITLRQSPNSPWLYAKITSRGIDEVAYQASRG